MNKFLMVASYPDSLLIFRGALIAELQASNLSVHVAAPDLSPGTAQRSQLESLGLTVHDIPMQRTGTSLIADIKTLIELYRVMRNVRPVAMLGYTIKPVIYGIFAALLAGIPRRYALITGLGYAFQGESASGLGGRALLQRFVKRLYSLALLGADKVFFQNPDDCALFRGQGIVRSSAKTVVVNGSGVDVREYSAVPLPPVGAGSASFLLIARLLGDKGVREYVAAARSVRSRYPEARFHLAGWIDSNPDAIKQSELDAWIDEGVIEYLGRLSDVRPAIAACSVYVLPSYREGTPRTVLEAMAIGRAIITTDAPGCRETVVHGNNGFLVPVKDVDALAAAMEQFMAAPALLEKMGRCSRTIAESKYDVNMVNAVMLREMEVY